MKNGVWYLGALCSIALVAGGCAKKELVKADQTIPPVTAAKPADGKTRKTGDTGASRQAAPPTKENRQKDAQIVPLGNQGQLQAELQKIYFDFDSPSLSSASRAALDKDAEILKKNVSGKVTIEGHCDERGSDEYNLALGEKRAQAALRYLTALGVQADRLSVISYGKEKPADPGHTEAAWAKNRRDEFSVSR